MPPSATVLFCAGEEWRSIPGGSANMSAWGWVSCYGASTNTRSNIITPEVPHPIGATHTAARALSTPLRVLDRVSAAAFGEYLLSGKGTVLYRMNEV